MDRKYWQKTHTECTRLSKIRRDYEQESKFQCFKGSNRKYFWTSNFQKYISLTFFFFCFGFYSLFCVFVCYLIPLPYRLIIHCVCIDCGLRFIYTFGVRFNLQIAFKFLYWKRILPMSYVKSTAPWTGFSKLWLVSNKLPPSSFWSLFMYATRQSTFVSTEV